ncbi:hypothetical protein AVEN_214003-1 [Araneus ventricosus]|uniref:Uncharacterized protein n=1 Tax=Araneus ventricosus TaxID=182803 RepID=A0A4Y2NTW2_ARAVE|nr:hypothetical protein AVEN_214003-1 [Araneus ventricosus]
MYSETRESELIANLYELPPRQLALPTLWPMLWPVTGSTRDPSPFRVPADGGDGFRSPSPYREQKIQLNHTAASHPHSCFTPGENKCGSSCKNPGIRTNWGLPSFRISEL